MKTKHTPGPWYASDNERCIYAKLQTVDGTYVEPLIAQCTKLSTSANANAALIAASPEMFEALEKLYIKLCSEQFQYLQNDFEKELVSIEKCIQKTKDE